MVSAVPKGPVVTIGTRRISTTSKEMADLGHTEWCTSSLLRGVKGRWADAAGARPGTQAGDERIRRAKFHLQPTLKALRIDVDERKGRVDGTVELDMLWSFISAFRKDSVLFSVPKTTRVPVNDLPLREIITAPLEVAARQLLEDITVHEALTKAFNAGLVASKGDVVELKTPVPITFTGRKDMLGALVKGVVTLETSDGHGSGFMITNDGHLLTNAHVVGEDSKVKVRFEQGFALDGQVLKVNRDFDLALVYVPGTDLPAIALGDDAQLQLGEEIFAIGTPLDKQFGQTVTRGIMSGRREIEGRSYLQTDVRINPGNSGGPLIDEGGRPVGVATLKITASGVEGIGFGVLINKALEMLNIRFVP